MQNEIIINVDPGETRVAVLERSQFVELHIERDREKSVVGNVVKGRVTRVLPGMQAAFVDVGLEKAAFLYVGDYFSEASFSGGAGEEDAPAPRRGRGRSAGRQPPKIESVLQESEEIVVQVAKEPIGTKGARITSHISIPGRHLVLTPWSKRVGVSRRIGSDRERRRLREIVERLRPRELGFIIRTAGDGVREADLEADIRYLSSVWEDIRIQKAQAGAPSVLYSELDLPRKMVRDFVNADTKRITVDDQQAYERLRDFLDRFVADPKPRIRHYTGEEPVFSHHDLESQIAANLERKVWLKSGGYLIIDQSEALTAIDVNTGRYVGKRDLEETVLKTNLEAVKEVVHQLRFRNIGGLIIIDLIDMEPAENREKVYRALQDAIRQDKTKTNILKISELGLVEMTRKRTRENLVQTLCEPCANCDGRGYLLSRESVALKVLREIRTDLPRFCGRRVAVTVSPEVAKELLATDREACAALERDLGREIEIRARPGLHREQFEAVALDEGPPVSIPLRWLEDRKEAKQETPEAEASGEEPASEAAEAEEGEAAPAAATRAEEASGAEAADAPALETRPPEGELGAEDAGEGGEAAEDEDAKPPPPGLAEAGGPAEPAPQPLDEAAESRILRPSQEQGDS